MIRISCCMIVPVVVLLSALSITSPVFAEKILQVENKGIEVLSIPHPALEKLEAAVAKQLEEGKENLDLLLSKDRLDAAQLAMAYGYLGHLYHTYDFTDAAGAAYENAALIEPRVFRWRYSLGRLLQEKGDFREALGQYNIAGAIEAGTDLAYLVSIRIGECLKSLNDADGAEKAFGKAYRIKPGGPAILARLGEVAFERKEYKRAIEFLEAALAKKPDADKLHYLLAMAYRDSGDVEAARRHLARRGMVGIQPPDPLKTKLESLAVGYRGHILKGKLAFSAGRYEEAAAAFEKAVRAASGKPGGYINLGAVYGILKRYKEALKNLEKAAEIAPDNMTVHYNLGDLNVTLGNFEQAVKHLDVFIKANPGDGPAQLKLAEALSKSGREIESFDHYKAAVEADPALTQAWIHMSRLLSSNGQHREALMVLEEASVRLPDDGMVIHRLARELAASPDKRLRDGKLALKLARKVYEVSKTHETAKTAAMAYAELDRCDDALEWIIKSIAFAEKDSIGVEQMKVLKGNKVHFMKGSPCRVPMGGVDEKIKEAM